MKNSKTSYCSVHLAQAEITFWQLLHLFKDLVTRFSVVKPQIGRQ